MEAFIRAHCPTTEASLTLADPSRQRLKFDELVFRHFNKLVEESPPAPEPASLSPDQVTDETAAAATQLPGVAVDENISYSVTADAAREGLFVEPFKRSLPFELTDCQKNATEEILQDLAGDKRMIRLLQGDVGSGKTVVLAIALLRAVEAGRQGVLLAPTELLARQHFDLFTRQFEVMQSLDASVLSDSAETTAPTPTPIAIPRIRLLTGSITGKERAALLRDLNEGQIDILIGTHAVLSKGVVGMIPNLGLSVIDEEHKFGVGQREKLCGNSNVLHVTATPIPRSLAKVRF